MLDKTQRPAPDRSHVSPVDTREELIYLLSRASELEHGLACVYLFASYSLKSDPSEGGLTDEGASLVRGWKRRLAAVAVEEMLHLAQVSNMLTAVGGAPHFRRTNFPLPPTAFPFGIRLALEPFSQELIERFVCYEMPEDGVLTPEEEAIYVPMRERIAEREGIVLPAGAAGAPLATPFPGGRGNASEPYDIDFRTVGEFYHKIESGFKNIDEAELFIGPPEAQANARYVDLGGALHSVVDRASACEAIEMIVQQGEAPTSSHPDAHFSVFDTIRREYEAAVREAAEEGVPFEPVRPVARNPMTRFYDDSSGGTPIGNPLTHEVADLFNVSYDTMLLMLLRFFSHTEESESELEALSRATLRIMTTVIRPLGEALAMMPMDEPGGPNAAMTAGPGFGYNRDVHLLPHKRSAWVFYGERLRDLALTATELHASANGAALPPQVEEATAALQALAVQFAQADGPWSAPAESADFGQLDAGFGRTIRPETNGPYLVTNVERLLDSKNEPRNAQPNMALCRCGGSKNKPFCDGTHAAIGFSSAKLPGRVPDRRDDYVRGTLTIHDNRGICQHAGFCTDALPDVFRAGREPFVDPAGADVDRIVAQIEACPSGALTYSLDDAPPPSVARDPQIAISKNGPYRVAGDIALDDDSWGRGAPRDRYALCRCGGSKNKPFCDGSHWYNGFTDDAN